MGECVPLPSLVCTPFPPHPFPLPTLFTSPPFWPIPVCRPASTSARSSTWCTSPPPLHHLRGGSPRQGGSRSAVIGREIGRPRPLGGGPTLPPIPPCGYRRQPRSPFDWSPHASPRPQQRAVSTTKGCQSVEYDVPRRGGSRGGTTAVAPAAIAATAAAAAITAAATVVSSVGGGGIDGLTRPFGVQSS